MGSVNIRHMVKEGLYKGEIIGFTKNGMAVYPNSVGANALDTCECCGTIIHSQLSDADFCPVCSVELGLVSEILAREHCLPQYVEIFDRLNNGPEFHIYHKALIRGFKSGINYGVKNAHVSIKDVLGFDTYTD